MDMDIDDILGRNGALASMMPGYEFRPQQMSMARDVLACLDMGSTLLAEAGTGTGKSLAYLVPIALRQKKTLISTGTKTLQEQLYFQDIPLLNQIMPRPVSAVLLKGRNNYLCLNRWHALEKSGQLIGTESEHERFRSWADVTETGDRSELDFLSDNSRLWQAVCSRPEACLGKRCGFFNSCFVMRLKIQAQKADVVIVNHHLLMADRMVRKRNRPAPLPDVEALVCDEAHLLESIATEFLGVRISRWDIQDIVNVILEYKPGSALKKAIKKVRESTGLYFESFGIGESRFALAGRYSEEKSVRAQKLIQALTVLLHALKREKSIPDEVRNELDFRLQDIVESIGFINDMRDPEYVFWGELGPKGATLHANPIDISSDLPGMLISGDSPLILTSATLTVDGSFEFVRSRLGFPDPETRVYPSPFNYPEQTLLYIPEHLPTPDSPDFFHCAGAEVVQILKASRGRALVLCTSYRGMHALKEMIQETTDYTLLIQGDAPKNTLLEVFRKDVHSILIATASFWQGVDVPGAALSCVVIDKLPFASPSDPITAARINMIKNQGGNPFFNYQIPMAVMSLKQGLGRLIRSGTDFGVAVILDKRIRRSRYGYKFIRSIPDFPGTSRLQDVIDFFRLQP